MAGLNEKQRAFCHEFIKNGGNATAAYETAYGRGNNSDVSLRTLGARTMKKECVKQYLAELREPEKAEAKATVQSLIDELEDARQVAKLMLIPSAMVAASMGKAKLLGLDKGNGGDDDEDAQAVSVTVTVRDARVSKSDA